MSNKIIKFSKKNQLESMHYTCFIPFEFKDVENHGTLDLEKYPRTRKVMICYFKDLF